MEDNCDCGNPGEEFADHDSNCVVVLCEECVAHAIKEGSRELPRDQAGRRVLTSEPTDQAKAVLEFLGRYPDHAVSLTGIEVHLGLPELDLGLAATLGELTGRKLLLAEKVLLQPSMEVVTGWRIAPRELSQERIDYMDREHSRNRTRLGLGPR